VPGATRSLTLEAKSAFLSAITEFVRKGAQEAGLSESRAGELELLIEELYLNACSHAYPDGEPGMVSVTYSIQGPGELKLEMADQGVAFNPLAADSPDTTLDLEHRPVGGLGILIVKRLATSITYRREYGWNRLTFSISSST
jgi:serine/threonine-protein kinase RsbW